MQFMQEADKEKDVEEDAALLRGLIAQNRASTVVRAGEGTVRKADRLPLLAPAQSGDPSPGSETHGKKRGLMAATSRCAPLFTFALRWPLVVICAVSIAVIVVLVSL